MIGAWFATAPLRHNLAANYFNAGNNFFENKNDRQAILEYKKALFLDRKSDFYFALGQVYFLNQDFSLAESNFKKALQKSPDHQSALFGLSEVYLREQKYDQALNEIKNKNSDDLLKIQLARIYLAKEDISSAEDTIKDQSDNLARFYQTKLLLYQENYTEALNKLLEVEAHNDQKRTMVIAEPTENDIAVLGDAASSAPKISNKNTRKVIFGEALNQTQDAEIALPLLKKIAEENPTYRDAWVFLGHSYLLLKKFESAKDSLLKAKELDPINYATWLYLGEAYKGLGNEEMAKTCADKAEKLQ